MPLFTVPRTAATLLAVLLLATATQAAAAELPPTPTLTHAVASNWVKFRMAAGRVTIAETQVGNMSTSSNAEGRSERFALAQLDTGGPSLKYELTTAEETLSVDAGSGERLRIVRTRTSAALPLAVEFRQSPGEPLTLTVGPAQPQTCRAASLWHLLILYPDICREHLLPLLERLRPGWKLDQVAAAVEKELLHIASGGAALDRGHWAALVTQLGDDQFARREAADRQLRAAGPAVLGYLQQLEGSRLDAEQQFRVQRIIARLSAELTGETAEQIASWLSGDASIWLALLSRDDASTRRLAARQLAAVLGEPVVFDPDAAAEVRGRQITKLRARIEGRREQPGRQEK